MGTNITIATLNIWGNVFSATNFKQRAKKICNYFNESSVDIIQFQEVFTYPKLLFFKKNLTSFPYVVYKKYLFGPRGGLATFSKKPFEEIKYKEFSKKLIRGNFNPGIQFTGKGMLKTKLQDCPFSFINTHLSPSYVSPSYKTKDENKDKYDTLSWFQINQLKSFIQKDKIAIITGDFNIAKGTQLYQKLINVGLIDIFNDTSLSTFHNEFAASDGNNYRLDYIFIRADSKFTISSKNHLFTKIKVSDHIGLQATINF